MLRFHHLLSEGVANLQLLKAFVTLPLISVAATSPACFAIYRRYIFAALFTVVVVVVMLNLLVSLLNDLYEELKNLATADWCLAQVGSTLTFIGIPRFRDMSNRVRKLGVSMAYKETHLIPIAALWCLYSGQYCLEMRGKGVSTRGRSTQSISLFFLRRYADIDL